MIILNAGDIFGELEVIGEDTEEYKERDNNTRYYRCKCSCGKIVSVAASRLKSNNLKSCRCNIFKRGTNKDVKFKISKEAYEIVSKFNWLVDIRGSVKTYVAAFGEIRLTRLLANKLLDTESKVKFKNMNALDLRYSNMSSFSTKTNRSTRNLYYNKRKKSKQWYAYSTGPSGRTYIGCFDTEDEAADARDLAEGILIGEIYTLEDTIKSYNYIEEIINNRIEQLELVGSRHVEVPTDLSLGRYLEIVDSYCKIDENNNINEYKIHVQSDKKINWICPNGHKLRRTANNMYNHNYSCCYCNRSNGTSSQENYLYELFKNNFENVEQSYRITPSSKELDIIVWDAKIGIEFNGAYWHRFDTEEKRIDKAKIANTLGLKLYFINAYSNNIKTELINKDEYTVINVQINKTRDIENLFEYLLNAIDD